MFGVRIASRLTGCLRHTWQLAGTYTAPASHSFRLGKSRAYNSTKTGTGSRPQRWLTLEPDLDDALVPRKMAVSPLESWLSLHYTLPRLDSPSAIPIMVQLPEGNNGVPNLNSLIQENTVNWQISDSGPRWPSEAEEILEEQLNRPVPLVCKNVLEIRRRKMNRHKYKKLLKRTKFLRRKVNEGRRKKKQHRFEKDLKRVWKKAGLKNAPEGWHTPKIYVRQGKSD
ncbi:aurora kinase A-interacting protein [Erpetoichthys calabaricus]|uniref:aurora kinase A-interacting protein n=1 Tax=Erpetoichthys calabaricus TaxID=27687 RepID=UPI0022348E05|nr:aurora kinase A-interacting protein [Erpetoichthys calabaricus]